ncbi:MAG TPA: SDR family oxidoreductase [Thermoplasmata archaeon]|nr:SDR family oxidoreductase [Thermoplasmata archaeon]
MTPESSGPRPLALVTGASRGLGEVLARVLAGEGFDLLLTARDGPALDRVRAVAAARGGAAHAIPGDITDVALRARLAQAVGPSRGLDLLVNNAATLGPTPLRSLIDLEPAALEEIYRVNVVGPIALVRALRPALRARRGLIVNLSSDAAVGGYPGWGGYGATKAALDLVSLTLAHELAVDGISVVSVDPGDLRTPGAEPAFPPEEFRQRPSPEVTIPFWAWLLGQARPAINGLRFQAQAEHWGVPP